MRILKSMCIGDCIEFLGTILLGNKSSSSSSSVSSSSSTMETAPRAGIEPGLKSLTASPHLNHSCINRANLVPSPPLISPTSSLNMERSYGKKKKNRVFPPPIPLLARTENLPCHMPWVLKRCYVDGRLVLHEVPVKHHEYFKAQRSNGRLVLRLMYIADDQLHPNKNTTHHVDVNEDAPTSSLNDEEDAVESDDDDERCLNIKQEEEVGVAEEMVAEKQQKDKVMKRVLNESRLYSSSMPEGRTVCLPKDDFFRIGTPTIRPIYS